MIVVLDTNVIVSAILSPRGNSAEIIRRWESDAFEVATSPALLMELRKALSYQRVQTHIKLSARELNAFLRYFQSMVINSDPQETFNVIEDDPEDNRVLECAVEAKASFVVSGDRHLLHLKEYRGIVILPPAGFLALLVLNNR